MRILFAGAPAAGHLFPLAGLARVASAAGHEVAIASLDGADMIGESGVPWHNIRPGFDWRTEFRAAGAAHPELMRRVIETNSADRAAFLAIAAHVNAALVDELTRTITGARADVVIYEYLLPAALVAAHNAGVPAVQHDLGFSYTPPLRAVMLAELGVSLDAPTIDVTPPSMIAGEPYGWAMRPVLYNGEQPLTVPPPQRPRVAVTLGTVAPKVDGLTRLARLIEAAGQTEAEFVLATGEMDISALNPLPRNVVPVGWAPWRALLDTCVGAVHHGGGGTTLAALDAGVPQLLLPDGSDRFIAAGAVTARGAGLSASAEDIPDALDRLLGDEKLRAGAAEVRAEIAAMPAPGAVLDQLITRKTQVASTHHLGRVRQCPS